MPSQAELKAELAQQRDAGGDDAPATKTIAQWLEDPEQQEQIGRALPSSMPAPRFTRLMLTAVKSQPLLMKADVRTVLAAGMQCAAVGLEPNTPLQHAWLLPFKNNRQNTVDVNFILGYQGMVELAMRHPRVRAVGASAVREADEFEIDEGSDYRLVHKPELDAEPGNIRFFYAIAHYANPDGYRFRAVPLWEIQQHRDKSQQKNGPAWNNNPVPMSLKTSLRILWPWIPKTSEAALAVAVDERSVDASRWFNPDGSVMDAESREAAAAEAADERCAECGEVDGYHFETCSHFVADEAPNGG